MQVTIDGTPAAIDARVFEADHEAFVLRKGRQTRVRIKDFASSSVQGGAGDGLIKAPMHGRVLEVLVGVGDEVADGQRLAVIEAMKMEHTLRAPFAGTVSKVPVAAGAQVVEGAEIMVIEPAKAG
jgi:3-methylcrotonyl-CoA carboxylase alpha subunit